MMKKVLFMLAMLTCIFASCSDGGSDEPVNPTPKPEEVKAEITIDSSIVTNGLSFGVAAGEQSVSFSVNTNWTLSIASTTSGATWCKASATSGGKGSATVKFTVDENTDYEDRSVSVTIKAGTASKTFTITQKGADALLVTTKKYEVAQEGGKIEVEVKANIDYQLSISESAKDWISEIESKSRALKTSKHTFEIAFNEEAEKREGKITFKSGDKVETVKVYQAGGAVLLLSKNEFNVNDAGETISVDIKSNVEYGVQMPDVDWITNEASSRGMSSHTLKYIISANEGYDNRSAEIIFYDKNSDLKDTLKVIQAQKDAIVISEKNISVDKEGGTIEVKVNTNVDFEVQIPTEATWITQTDSRALVEKNIYLKIEENTGDESRSANITITNQDSKLSETIVIAQQGNITVATLKEAGTLKSLLGNDYLKIKSLKIVGPINGDDVYYLQKMLGSSNFSEADWGNLSTLDLSETTIVEGGECYYAGSVEDPNYNPNSSERFKYKELHTQNNELGTQIFMSCSNLKNITLPNSCTMIGNKAFYNCKSLNSVIVNNGITTIGWKAFAMCNKLTSITIGNAVTSIGENAFSGCNSLETITIPDNVTSIRNAFRECESLTSIVIGNGVKEIVYAAFYKCKKLTDITIGIGVTTIGDSAFGGCENIKNVYISDLSTWLKIDFREDVETYATNPLRSGGKLFLNNELLTELRVPDDITKINHGAFYGCSSLKQVIIHDKVTEVGEAAFKACSSLEKTIIGKGMKTIHNRAFQTKSLKECYSYSTTPPEIKGTGAYNESFSSEANATLYVPAKCGAKYNVGGWRVFKNIIEMD